MRGDEMDKGNAWMLLLFYLLGFVIGSFTEGFWKIGCTAAMGIACSQVGYWLMDKR